VLWPRHTKNPHIRRKNRIVVRELQFEWSLESAATSPAARFTAPGAIQYTARGNLNEDILLTSVLNRAARRGRISN
jgi:hypothetical protein